MYSTLICASPGSYELILKQIIYNFQCTEIFAQLDLSESKNLEQLFQSVHNPKRSTQTAEEPENIA